MKRENIDFLVDKGLEIVESTRLGYTEVKGPKGNKLWVTEKPPVNPAMSTDF